MGATGWRGNGGRWLAAAFAALLFLVPRFAAAGEGGHGAHGGHGSGQGGEKVFAGKAGPLEVEARLVDMMAAMARSGVSAKSRGQVPHSHHFMVSLAGGDGKKGGGPPKGTVRIKGPDGKETAQELIPMGDHAGCDVSLKAPGTYAFRLELEAEGKKGTASFNWVRKP